MNIGTKTRITVAAAGIALGGACLGTGVAGAEPIPSSDTISLSIGNVTILESADLVKATQVAGAVCNIDAAEANTVAQKAATETTAQTVCNLPGGAVTFAQASSVSEMPDTDWPAESGHSQSDAPKPVAPVDQLPG